MIKSSTFPNSNTVDGEKLVVNPFAVTLVTFTFIFLSVNTLCSLFIYLLTYLFSLPLL